MRVKGAPVVKDNKTSGTGSNVYIGKGRKLNVNGVLEGGALEDGACVGFTMADQEGNNDPNITFTTGFKENNERTDRGDRKEAGTDECTEKTAAEKGSSRKPESKNKKTDHDRCRSGKGSWQGD